MPAPSPKAAAAKKKAARKFHPIALHLMKAYETSYKMGFLLNKSKCFMGSARSGFALNCPTIRRLRGITNRNHEIEFATYPFHYGEEDKALAQKLNMMLGHSVVGVMAEPIRKFTKQLLDAIESLDANDESEVNKARVIAEFQKPLGPVDKKNPQKTLTPIRLVQQLQRSIAMLRQRFQMELDTLHQLRCGWITTDDCWHALEAANPMEIKGRLLAATEILRSYQGMKYLKHQKFSGEFHPKITLDRAIQNIRAWGPGTPPRSFQIAADAQRGKIPVLNDRLLEQLEVFNSSVDLALGYEFHLSTAEESIEKLKQTLKKYFASPDEETPPTDETAEGEPSGDSQDAPAASEASETPQPKEEAQVTPSSTKPAVSGPESVVLNNPMSLPEILQFYETEKQGESKAVLNGLLFENASAKYLTEYALTVTQAKDLRGTFTTLQMDLTHLLDLYFLEVRQVHEKLKKLTQRIGVELQEEETVSITQPGEKTRKLLFPEALNTWTQNYTEICKKYLIIEAAIQEKLLEKPEAIQAVAEMPAQEAIEYLDELRALLKAQKKGYISEEQKERYLNPELTPRDTLQSIMAFFKAIEKYDYPKRCEEIAKCLRELHGKYAAIVEANPSQARALKDPMKQAEDLANNYDPNTLVQELLNAEVFGIEPKKVDLLMERTLFGLELKIDYDNFHLKHETLLKELTSNLKSNFDLGEYSELFYQRDESPETGLLNLFNRINGTPDACMKNVFHENDNTMIRECVLRPFELQESGLSGVGSVTSDNVQEILGIDYCTDIMIVFQNSFLIAVRRVFALDAETRRSENNTNHLGVSEDRVTEMRSQCEAMLDKQVPLSYALKNLEAIWQTLDKDKIVSKEAKIIAELQQKLEGNVAGGSSLLQRLKNNPENLEMMEDYQRKSQEAYANYRKLLEDIATRLRNLKRQAEIPSYILEYQRQILSMERSILQTAEEIKEGCSPQQAERFNKQIKDKQVRIHKYRKILDKFQKENPDLEIPPIS